MDNKGITVQVLDSKTDEPISNALVVQNGIQGNEYYTNSEGIAEVILSDTGIRSIKVEAVGYITAKFPMINKSTRYIRLKREVIQPKKTVIKDEPESMNKDILDALAKEAGYTKITEPAKKDSFFKYALIICLGLFGIGVTYYVFKMYFENKDIAVPSATLPDTNKTITKVAEKVTAAVVSVNPVEYF